MVLKNPHSGKHIPHNSSICMAGHPIHDLARRVGMSTNREIRITNEEDRKINHHLLVTALEGVDPMVRARYLEEFDHIYR